MGSQKLDCSHKFCQCKDPTLSDTPLVYWTLLEGANLYILPSLELAVVNVMTIFWCDYSDVYTLGAFYPSSDEVVSKGYPFHSYFRNSSVC